MSSEFVIIREEFDAELAAINDVLLPFDDPKTVNPKARVAAVNACTLLLAATFEEFVREMARAYARLIIKNKTSLEQLPPKVLSTVWRRTTEALAGLHKDIRSNALNREATLKDASLRFEALIEFSRGDLSKDIYRDLVHNENNMRPTEINGLFSISGLTDICLQVCAKKPLLDLYAETEAGKAHGQLLGEVEDFFERRNLIAHSIAAMKSSGHDMIAKDIKLLQSFAIALSETLDVSAGGVTA